VKYGVTLTSLTKQLLQGRTREQKANYEQRHQCAAASVEVVLFDLVDKDFMVLVVVHIRFAFVLVKPPKGRWVYLLVTFTLNTAEVFVLDAIKPATILLASISLFCSCNKAVRAAKTFL